MLASTITEDSPGSIENSRSPWLEMLKRLAVWNREISDSVYKTFLRASLLNLWRFHIMQPNSVPPYSLFIPVASPYRRKQNKISKQTKARTKGNTLNQNRTATTTTTKPPETAKSLLLLSGLSITSSSFLMAWEASVCPISVTSNCPLQ